MVRLKLTSLEKLDSEPTYSGAEDQIPYSKAWFMLQRCIFAFSPVGQETLHLCTSGYEVLEGVWQSVDGEIMYVCIYPSYFPSLLNFLPSRKEFLHSPQTGTVSLSCLLTMHVSLPFGNSLLSICFAPVQSVQPDGNSFEIYLFKSQLHISPLIFLLRFSSCPCVSWLAAAPSLQAVLSPGLWTLWAS